MSDKHLGARLLPLDNLRPGADVPRPGRMALHANELELDHPRSGERITFRAELPTELEHLRDWARA